MRITEISGSGNQMSGYFKAISVQQIRDKPRKP